MHATDIVGYTYNADIICSPCLRTHAAFTLAAPGEAAFMGRPTDGDTTEQFLDRWAASLGVNRDNEHSFDSDVFPKVIFESQVECCERCGTCNEHLIGDEDCVKYPHDWTLGGAGLCANGRCRTLGSGDTCNDGDCLYHPENPEHPDNVFCEAFREDGSCIHSDCMMAAGL